MLFLLFALVSSRERLVWLCLERCGDSAAASLAEVEKHKDLLTGVSFESYDLGAEGTLVDNGFTDVAPALQQMGLSTYAMITTVSNRYLEELLDLENPPIIAAALRAAEQRNLTGFDLDFEPNDATSEEMAQKYSVFLSRFTAALRANGLELTADIASWNTFWNFTVLANSTIDHLHQMDT